MISRRSTILAALSAVPAATYAVAGSSAANPDDPVLAAEARLGEALVREQGPVFAAALAARTAPGALVADEFRAGNMVSIGGFWFSASEAVRFLAAAGLVGAR